MRRTDTIKTIKGIGEKTEKLFQKLGVSTVGDLIQYYPRDYDVYESPKYIKEVGTNGKVAVVGRVVQHVQMKKVRNLTILTTDISDGTGTIQITFFNMPFLRNALKIGATYVFRQKVTKKLGKLIMEQPEMFTMAAYDNKLHSMQPIYGLTKGITNNLVSKAMAEVLKVPELFNEETIPKKICDTHQLCTYQEAIHIIHFPKNKEELLIARKRLVFEEFLYFILALSWLKEAAQEQKNTFDIKETWETEQVIEQLPYTLTNAQMRVWLEIERNLKGHTLMARLVQGDVGSGKTILAFLAMIMLAQNGYQSALMVPTEVLARQHYEALCELLEEHDLIHYNPVLLTGSQRAKEKREIYEQIALGESKMIVGTHALIQEKVEYERLGLVITDEQHRFGVKQRDTLSQKGGSPHVLVMSATPIPRTLAIILYGDLDISVIDELPARRLPIKNCVVNTGYREKAYCFIEREILSGRQAYVICPMVEESEGLEAENVEDYSVRLKARFGEGIVVEALHGRMKPALKNEIMERFAKNEIQILVSTTVVEVGVNVPNAVVMMVENAERFGLAQLHQLRGRVGRGEHQSYCIFVQGNDQEETNKRLEILNHSNDGFFIASEDLKLRGPGDLFGIRQSGIMDFKIGDIYQDAKILQLANEAAREILEEDYDLEQEKYAVLKTHLEEYITGSMEGIGL